MTNKIASGIPMTLEQMQSYLQELYGLPVVLRKEGATMIRCAYCNKDHVSDPWSGHQVAACDDEDRDIEIVIADRSFIPNYGYTTLDYRENGDVNELLTHDEPIYDP